MNENRNEITLSGQAGTVTIGIDYYTSLIVQATKTEAKLEAMKAIVDGDHYGMANDIRRLFGWPKPETEEK
ncbi:hypothetical protein IKP13_05355 [bacterium]|nr:hypothetical protein [bacterium]